jgi:hypothetical protein
MRNSPILTHFIEDHDGPRDFEDWKSADRDLGCCVVSTWRQLPHFKDVSAFFFSTTTYSSEVRCLYTTLQIKALQTFETSVTACVYQSIRRLIPEHLNFQRRRFEKIRTRHQKYFLLPNFAVQTFGQETSTWVTPYLFVHCLLSEVCLIRRFGSGLCCRLQVLCSTTYTHTYKFVNMYTVFMGRCIVRY